MLFRIALISGLIEDMRKAFPSEKGRWMRMKTVNFTFTPSWRILDVEPHFDLSILEKIFLYAYVKEFCVKVRAERNARRVQEIKQRIKF